MRKSWLFSILTVTAALSALASCNSTIDSGSDNDTTTTSATGVWSGSDSVSGLGITALINSAGQATFIRSDGVQFTGAAQVSGNTLAVTVDGYSDFPNAFSDGSTYGIGTLNGSVTTGSTLTATLSFTTNDNTAISGSWSLTFEAQSNSGSSLGSVNVNFTDPTSGTVLAINSNGAMSSQNPTNSCVLNGSISTSDTSHDIYEVSYTYEDCTGTYAVLNGVQFTGLAYLNTNLSPQQLTIAVAGSSSSSKYAIVSSLNQS
jgi:hypothetical protein